MSNTETTITRKILKHLNSISGCRAIKLHMTHFGQRGTPDILCCKDGQTVFFEVKVPDRSRLEVMQAKQFRDWRAVGAECHMVTGIEDLPGDFRSGAGAGAGTGAGAGAGD